MKHNEMAQNSEESESKVVVQKIPLDLLVPSVRYSSRRCRAEEQIQKVIRLLLLHGQREALHVYPGEGEYKGKYMVVSGVTRLMAAKALGWQVLDAIVDHDLDPNDHLELVRLSRLYNDTAAETDIDHAAVVAELEEEGYSQEEIMLAMGFNTPHKLFDLGLFWELPQSIFDIAAQHPDKFSARVARIMSKAVSDLGEDKALLLAEELIAENLSERKLEGRIQIELRKMTRSPSRSTKERETAIRFGGEKVGSLRVTHPPNSEKRKTLLEVYLPDSVTRELHAKLERIFEEMEEKWQAAQSQLKHM